MQIQHTGFLRLHQIIGRPADPRKNRPEIPPLIPVSKSTWWAGCKAGRYPAPIRLSGGITVWKTAQVIEYIENAAREDQQ